MRIFKVVVSLMLFVALFLPVRSFADSSPSLPLETAMSEILDIWRDGQYEELFEHLGKRGKISREQFVRNMRESTIKPACCWQKMEHFKVLDEKKKTATVYVKIGLEGMPGQPDSVTREFKLVNERGEWKMLLNDVIAIAGGIKKKHKKVYHRKVGHYQ